MTSARTPEDGRPEPPATLNQRAEVGRLGRVLRWPVRGVAMGVILPAQVGWELLAAFGRAVRERARPAVRVVMVPLRFAGRWLRRGVRFLFHWLWVVVRRTTYGLARALWSILFYPGLFTVRAAREAARLKRLLDAGGGALGEGRFDNFREIRRADKPLIADLPRIAHQSLLFASAWWLLAVALAARAAWRLYNRVRPQLRTGVKWLFGMPWRGLVLVVRLAVRLVFRPFAEGVAIGYRIGRKIGRRLVTILAAACRVIWGTAVGRALRSLGRRMRALMSRSRAWYRREISGPVGAALRAARRDVRRVLTGRRGKGKPAEK